jgi:hypothetical protein
MKRVHDHKEELSSATGSPLMDAPPGPRKAVGRKRKASGSLPNEPSMHRQRSASGQVSHSATPVTQQTQVGGQRKLSHSSGPQDARPAMTPQRTSQQRQRQLYSQWANQREVIARQMDFVQSPDDEANLQRLSQNIEELRRLSQEARRG